MEMITYLDKHKLGEITSFHLKFSQLQLRNILRVPKFSFDHLCVHQLCKECKFVTLM